MWTYKYSRTLSAWVVFLFAIGLSHCQPPAVSQPDKPEKAESVTAPTRVLTGAEVLVSHLPDSLSHKRIGLVANHTSLVGGTHLADTLQARGISLVRVFSPEHGFRGQADAGAKVTDGKDLRTGLPIVSLYGDHKKPRPEEIKDLDLVIFDLQDVGSRHYTYPSTLTYVMEACAEAGVPLWVLDRPNPNGWFVDGPMMEPAAQSFIGMHPVPLVHGMTMGELAKMIQGKGWIAQANQLVLKVIACEGYSHAMRWSETGLPWIPPSPNLGTVFSAEIYPATCWLEATIVSEGRGTDSAFVLSGAPWFKPLPLVRGGFVAQPVSFIPVSIPGKSSEPKLKGQLCHGYKIAGAGDGKSLVLLGLDVLLTYEKQHPAGFFTKGFERWAGNTRLATQINQQLSAEEIWQSWQEDIADFKLNRKSYLLYTDFE